MKNHQIDIMAIQETKIDYNEKLTNKYFTWYHSGLNRMRPEGQMVSGVGIIINNKIANYITDVEPINDRVIKIEIEYRKPVVIFCVYAPTAASETSEKEKFYEILQKEYDKHKYKKAVYIIGDWNARIQKAITKTEKQCIGKHTFDKTNTTLTNQTEKTQENRKIPGILHQHLTS